MQEKKETLGSNLALFYSYVFTHRFENDKANIEKSWEFHQKKVEQEAKQTKELKQNLNSLEQSSQQKLQRIEKELSNTKNKMYSSIEDEEKEREELQKQKNLINQSEGFNAFVEMLSSKSNNQEKDFSNFIEIQWHKLSDKTKIFTDTFNEGSQEEKLFIAYLKSSGKEDFAKVIFGEQSVSDVPHTLFQMPTNEKILIYYNNNDTISTTGHPLLL